MVGKIAQKESRGTLFGAFSFFGSCGVILMNKLGGHLFDKVNILWPFGISLIAYLVLSIVVVVAGVTKLIKM